MERINVTKTFLPPIEEYQSYLRKIWNSGQTTNQGPLLLEFENKLRDYLGVSELHFVANGTVALQVSLKALNITQGEIITTPFSYVATTSSILWERCTPIFVDIEPETFCIDANKIENAITPKTKAIMAVHVFGYPCDIEKINSVAKKHKLKVIYDAAHAFGAEYKNKSLLAFGDISTTSFHATKIFHTIEGGCVLAKDKKVSNRVEVIKRFGHTVDEHYMLGINAKASEFQASMGLCNLNYIEDLIKKRKKISQLYDKLLGEKFQRPSPRKNFKYNYGYYPVVLDSEIRLIKAMRELAKRNIFPRRYFYPSLNTLPYLNNTQSCPVSEDITKRVMCLPLYDGLKSEVVEKICDILKR